jgi:hypothetical protein
MLEEARAVAEIGYCDILLIILVVIIFAWGLSTYK